MNQETRQKARAAFDILRKQRNEIAQWYGSMQHSTTEAWQDVKTGFLENYQSLAVAFGKSQEEFLSRR